MHSPSVARQARKSQEARGRKGVERVCTPLKIRGMLGQMPVIGLEAEAARRELESVLKSPGFVRNERLSAFLRFLIARHLEERDTELKESVIGVEVFGRK